MEKASWGQLLKGQNGIRSLTLVGGVALHAVNVYIVITILPSLVSDIGGQRYYSWAATLFIIASLIGAAIVSQLIQNLGPRKSYICAALIFAIGSFGCSLSYSMPMFLLSRFVQGFGGGLLLSLTYSMVRIVFDRPFWSLAMALISGAWGISTLLGPAIGGIFAEYTSWRFAFGFVGLITIIFIILAAIILPLSAQNHKASRLPLSQIGLLAAVVLVISTGSASNAQSGKILGLVVGFVLFLIFSYFDKKIKNYLLPKGTFKPNHELFSIYLTMLCILIVVNGAELYLPLFLQVLHHLSPLPAGYLASLMSIGWTCGTLSSATINKNKLPLLIKSAPFLSVIGILALLLLIPTQQSSLNYLITISFALLIIGIGAGGIWPHLLTRVLQTSNHEDADRASTSLTIVQLFATALSAAISGTIVNMAGLNDLSGLKGTLFAAHILFLSLLIILLFSIIFCFKISRNISQNKEENN